MLLFALCGCDQLFGLHHVDPGVDARGDAPRDGMRDADPDALGDATTITCPAGYASYAMLTNKYRKGADKNWLDAEIDCELDRGTATGYTHLVVMGTGGDDLERSYVNTFVFGAGVSGWIGASDLHKESNWLWVSNEPIPSSYPGPSGSPWATSEPNGSAGENCVQMLGAADFNDYDCNAVLPYVCECDTHAPVMANYTP